MSCQPNKIEVVAGDNITIEVVDGQLVITGTGGGGITTVDNLGDGLSLGSTDGTTLELLSIGEGDGIAVTEDDGKAVVALDASFLDLNETPGAYVAGAIIRVNAAGDALEFLAPAADGSTLEIVSGMPTWVEPPPSATLVAAFMDAGTNYDPVTGVWAAENDATLELNESGTVTVDGDNRVVLASGVGSFSGNAALLAALADMGDMTVITLSDRGGWSQFYMQINGSNRLEASRETTRNYMQNTRAGSYSTLAPSTTDSAFRIIKYEFPNGGASELQVEDDTPDVAGASTADATISPTSITLSSQSGTNNFGAVLIYRGLMDDALYASIIAEITENADYGAGSYTP